MSNLSKVIENKNMLVLPSVMLEERLKTPDRQYVLYVNEIGTAIGNNGQLEGSIPHIHMDKIARNNKPIPFTCIQLESNDYFLHDKYRETLDELGEKKYKRILDNFLRMSYVGKEKVDGWVETNWDYLKFKWNRGGSMIKVKEDTTQPDYTTLPTHSTYHG